MGAKEEFSKAIGHKGGDTVVAWNKRDLLIYAVGIGAKRDELPFLYELHPNFHALPTYPLVLGLKGATPSISNFAEMKDAGGPTPGIPALDPNRLVHAEQSILILKPIPFDSSEQAGEWKLKRECVAVKDTGKGLIIDSAVSLYSPHGEEYVRMIGSAYAFGKYGDGESKGWGKSIAKPHPVLALPKPPANKPDIEVEEATTEEQAVIYRLSGDYNPLHIDPSIGQKLGFPGAILHGISSYGFSARAIVLKVAEGDGRRLRFMSARFTSPVMPGDVLVTKLWLSKVTEGDFKGQTRVDFVTFDKTSGKLCLGGGVAVVMDKGAKL